MDPHLLRTFVAVAETGSFSAAADRLAFTQSAVSQQIAALESDLGTPLLTRRPVTLTAAGSRLLRHARLLLVRMEAARADVTRSVVPPGRLVLAVTPLAWTGAVAGALAELRAASTRLSTRLLITAYDRAVTLAVTGEADLALADGFTAPSDPLRLPDPGAASAVRVTESPAVLALPTAHPLAARSAVSLADLADAYWIDAPEIAPFTRLPVDGLRAGTRYEGTDATVLTGLIATGHGLAVLPAPVAAAASGVAAVPITAPRLVHRIELLRSPAVPDPADPAARFAALLTGDS
ncbi:LysR family transcriptional regulator [Actinoplanes sp. NPDC051851]|uniref:LysR family transcriptional regulator n=1 Tax=Actinoplanes sp. NPDC051851 TaxID=3154753 RepID=UPI003413C744